MTKSMPQLADATSRMVVYIPKDLHAWVKDEASKQQRSMSNFVQAVLLSLHAQRQEH
jgi:predicted HicB family RNase H-like nuclease